MILIPAVDVKNGRCVRLHQGRMDAETVYADDPLAMAQHWVEQGARWLHVIDLDGAVEGEPRNLSAIEAIVKQVSVPVQVGGGIRSRERIERYLALGVARVIVSTLAVEQPALTAEICRDFRGHIAISLDARDGKVAVKGWRENAALDYLDVARQIDACQPAVLIFTAIQRDGTLEGPDVPRLKSLLTAVNTPVIAAGGIGCLAHIQDLLPLGPAGLSGIIVGKALYDGSVIFGEALALTQSE
ncbi:MAG TPA: 1-(5-phosphoribosyl)-5-[(5-phosphoribosylamino)methylideneamino]imidazole-4-carboxamide isomerase [Alphaproteobacteria bacterium]|nr:1-(5-phosphoribosyl)-5-[(5-phosphoribosylamino)methylideneamino]imidazole-4-carboxamide isomerase [Alphaproteobacteria bacterium]